jgi:hypothetical protein
MDSRNQSAIERSMDSVFLSVRFLVLLPGIPASLLQSGHIRRYAPDLRQFRFPTFPLSRCCRFLLHRAMFKQTQKAP